MNAFRPTRPTRRLRTRLITITVALAITTGLTNTTGSATTTGLAGTNVLTVTTGSTGANDPTGANVEAAGAAPALPVQDRFQALGPAPVTTGRATDAAGRTYTLHHPSNLTDDGFANPIVTWGNGSNAGCADYAATLAHLASWGFVVICADSGATGWGTRIWAAVQHLIAENARDGSVFHDRLDTTRIGAAGHSQGATGALNANVLSNGAITSTVPLAFVDPWWHVPARQRPDLPKVKNPVFLVSGATDFLTFQSRQQTYFDRLTAPAAKAAVVGKGHNGMVRAATAYTTAWFLYTLRDDAFARGAFAATDQTTPEIRRNPAWTGWAAKDLP
ncbi:hypothetical protein SAMN04489712_110231 [Thermomonospora echinospora]|uniref:poly(ethylene terephthalate) hydrolase n=1 Tax=Thermomonospora echinospora TaxID=1992 RepID=A0A1H6CN89_9ACTN|nr:alpha/beta hydrolase [Thermomonospora echinospora]SEG74489.1 hypothetical protein SAMN04489712_110231 [Thermomonospora echinospora]